MSGKIKIHFVASALTALAFTIVAAMAAWPMIVFLIALSVTGFAALVLVYTFSIPVAEALLGECLSSTTENDD